MTLQRPRPRHCTLLQCATGFEVLQQHQQKATTAQMETLHQAPTHHQQQATLRVVLVCVACAISVSMLCRAVPKVELFDEQRSRRVLFSGIINLQINNL